ncbi:MAG: ROK family protein [Acidimicrobiales bacterium]
MGHASETALAIDVGGTKIEAALVDAGGTVSGRTRVPTGGDDGEQLYRRVLDVVDGLRGAPFTVCGVGCGGPMTPGGVLVSPLNIPQWRNFPLGARLADLLGVEVFPLSREGPGQLSAAGETIGLEEQHHQHLRQKLVIYS